MYKPQPLEFNPSQAVMQGAGAFSRLGDSFVQQAYQQDRAKQADKQFGMTHRLGVDKFNYGKERDLVTDKQWQETFNQTGDNIRFNQAMKVADYTAGREDAGNINTYRNNTLGLQGRELALKQQALNDAKDGLGSFADWYTQNNPSLKNIQGLTPQGVAKIAEFEAKKTPSEYQNILGSIKLQELESKKQQQRDYRAKNFNDVIVSNPLYNSLNENQKAQYYNHFVETGRMPTITKQNGTKGIPDFVSNLTGFGSPDTYSFSISDSNATQYDPTEDVKTLKELTAEIKAFKGK